MPGGRKKGLVAQGLGFKQLGPKEFECLYCKWRHGPNVSQRKDHLRDCTKAPQSVRQACGWVGIAAEQAVVVDEDADGEQVSEQEEDTSGGPDPGFTVSTLRG
eukprot:Hpha_TRINITY_DN16056_c2_g1::TRINITY_DN16056_c2_g1_i1::g.121301::m.121301